MLHPRAHIDVADEGAVRKMVEDAGFDQVSISYGLACGESRLGNLTSRLTIGSDEVRLVGAVKPEAGPGR
jgi:hypothetical protein